MNPRDSPSYTNFGHHVPRILRRQLIFHLLEQYLSKTNKENQTYEKTATESQTSCLPSIQRFYGALLFVDISGFTALSLRLSVDELKRHINDYFTTMLDIVDKHGGDVFKFAGDAIYIVWQADMYNLTKNNNAYKKYPNGSISEDEYVNGIEDILNIPNGSQPFGAYAHATSDRAFVHASKTAIEKAVECGLEISAACSNHKIIVENNQTETTNSITSFITKKLTTMNILKTRRKSAQSAMSPSKVQPEEENNCVYLNVHSGVSMGVMAGIDIGANDRWEYLLLGEPVTKVAVAESNAKLGEVVICPESHSIYHSNLSVLSKSFSQSKSRKNSRSSSMQFSSTDIVIGAGGEIVANSAAIVNLMSSSRHSFDATCTECTCTKLPNGYFLINKSVDKPLRGVVINPEGSKVEESSFYKYMKTSDEVTTDIETAFSANKDVFKKELFTILYGHLNELAGIHATSGSHDNGGEPQKPPLINNIQPIVIPRSTSGEDVISPLTKNGGNMLQILNKSVIAEVEKSLTTFIESNALHGHFMKWVYNCLLDDLVRHVHESSRYDYKWRQYGRIGIFSNFVAAQEDYFIPAKQLLLQKITENENENENQFVQQQNDQVASPNNIGKNKLRRESSTMSASSSKSKRLIYRQKPSISFHHRRGSAAKTNTANDTDLNAELRSVIVLFIKIEMYDQQLLIDHIDTTHTTHSPIIRVGRNKKSKIKSFCNYFNFLVRTENENQADALLLQKFQTCMSVIASALYQQGGQIRQFIVDDKGTVCIGTFGLRGSNTTDNAATALQAANDIINKLKLIGMRASIGVTAGKGYCGLVGSALRHEYAVMGPSTNLSARLMSKAPPYGIICDVQIRDRDRSRDHIFESLGEVNAKGYSTPVTIFKPTFKTTDEDTAHSIIYPSTNSKNLSLDIFSNSFEVTHAQHGVNSPLLPDKTISTVVPIGRKLISSISKSDFFLRAKPEYDVKNNLVKGSTNKKERLHGRSNEMEKVLEYLFNRLIREMSSFDITDTQSNSQQKINEEISFHGRGSSKSNIPPKRNVENYNIFDTNHKAILVTIVASQGMGKSSFISAVAHKVYYFSKQESNHNVTLFRIRHSSFNMHIPFHAWKVTISEMLVRIYRKTDNSSPKASTRNMEHRNSVRSIEGRRNASLRNVQVTKDEVMLGLDIVFKLLPGNLSAFKPLLSSISIISSIPDNETTMHLTGQAKLHATAELLAAIIQSFSNITGNIAFIAMDELQTMDQPSFDLLYQIWNQNCGIVMLASYTPFVGNGNKFVSLSSSLPSRISDEVGNKSTFDIMSIFNDAVRFLKFELLALDKEATFELIKDAALDRTNLHDRRNFHLANPNQSLKGRTNFHKEEEHLFQFDEQTLTKLYEISGGNPLYAYELTKGLIDKMQSNNTLTLNPSLHDNDITNTVIPIQQQLTPMNINVLTEVITAFRSNRIEEVICHRFDQLESECQLLLKIAAVSCSNGEPFNFDLLTFVFDDFIEPKLSARPIITTTRVPSGTSITPRLHTNNGLVINTNLNIISESRKSFNFIRIISTPKNNAENKSNTPKHGLQNGTDDSNNGSTNGNIGNSNITSMNLLEVLTKILSHDEFIRICITNDDDNNNNINNMNMINNNQMKNKKNSKINESFTIIEHQNEDSSAKSTSYQIESCESMINSLMEDELPLSEPFLKHAHFEFRMVLEQLTIYDLLLDDQKVYIHERIASYLNKISIENSIKNNINNISAEELLEEGFHWQQATLWCNAMSCYYMAAVVVDQMDDDEHSNKLLHLLSSYRMFSAMKVSNGIIEYKPIQSKELEKLFEKSIISSNNISNNNNYNSNIRLTRSHNLEEASPIVKVTLISFYTF
eukprot:gene8483-11467_t